MLSLSHERYDGQKILVKPDHHDDGVDDNGHDADGVGETSSVRTSCFAIFTLTQNIKDQITFRIKSTEKRRDFVLISGSVPAFNWRSGGKSAKSHQCSRFLGRYLKPAISSKPLYLPQSHCCD
jgi:hypothetical protein